MLSIMESSPQRSGPDDARSALAGAAEARQRLTLGLRLPAGLYPAMAAAVALQISTAAYGVAAQSLSGLAIILGGAAVFLAVAALTLRHFQRVNGVKVDGLTSQVVLATGATSTSVYLLGLGATTWAAFESWWWLVLAAAVAAGGGYVLGILRWWRTYRHDSHADGPSPRALAALAGLALVGFVALLLAS